MPHPSSAHPLWHLRFPSPEKAACTMTQWPAPGTQSPDSGSAEPCEVPSERTALLVFLLTPHQHKQLPPLCHRHGSAPGTRKSITGRRGALLVSPRRLLTIEGERHQFSSPQRQVNQANARSVQSLLQQKVKTWNCHRSRESEDVKRVSKMDWSGGCFHVFNTAGGRGVK